LRAFFRSGLRVVAPRARVALAAGSRATTFAAHAALALAVAGCGGGDSRGGVQTGPPQEPPWFVEVAEASGIRFRHTSGASQKRLLPEIMGGGAGWLDYDGDGRLDAYLVDSGEMGRPRAGRFKNRLFRNLGGGKFEDVADATGVACDGYGMGCAVGDYDGDGDPDLYVVGLGRNTLLRNDGGRFVDATDVSGTACGGWSTSAAFVDYDADGDYDLFVGRYVDWKDTPAFLEKRCDGPNGAPDYCSPQSYAAPSTAVLFRNDGGGRFTDVSEAAGLRTKAGTALGVLCTDLDGDGRVDLYVSNDQMFSFAWLNQGDGTFREDGLRLGVAVDEMGKSQAGMGVDAADVDGDGDLDLWKVHLDREAAALYLNQGGWFDDRTVAFGLAAPTRPRTGFGTGFFDADLDGLLDLFVANGRVERATAPHDPKDPYAEPSQFLRQASPGRFVDATDLAGRAVSAPFTARGAAFGDYDDDGDVDVLVVDRDGPARLLRNDAPRKGSWAGVRIVDGNGADAIGARVAVEVDGKRYVAEVRAAASYLSSNDPRLRFAVPSPSANVTCTVRYASGASTAPTRLAPGAYATLRR